ncbi:MAG: glycosyltransferase family 2 protein [Ilumatobacteraceae bacterium]|nr:glycosyltransferase family 2 protein [Ilumatobacteraceae bacterium]
MARADTVLSGVRTPARPSVSVVVPTNHRWAHVAAVIRPILAEAEALDVQIVVCGAGTDPVPAFPPHVTVVHDPGGDLYTARARGLAAATGGIVTVLEDHVTLEAGWLAGLVQEWATHADADALLYDVRCDPGASLVEQALFTITFGPFMAVAAAPRDRSPVPGMVSMKRHLLAAQPEPGDFEYTALQRVATSANVDVVDLPAPVHSQHVTWRAFPLNYHSGRAYGAACADRTHHARRIRRELAQVWRQTLAARRRTTGTRASAAFTACTLVLLACHAVGQAAGVVTRSPGRSHARLE